MKLVTPHLHCTGTLLLTIMLAGTLPTRALAVQFRDFFGTNQAGGYGPLWSTSLSLDRQDFPWMNNEPTQGSFDSSYFQWFINAYVTPAAAQNAMILPVLDYNASWSWDQTARTYYDSADGLENGPYGHAAYKYTVAPLGNNQFQYTTYQWLFSRWRQQSQSTVGGSAFFPIAADHVADWTNFVQHAVTGLKAAGVQYYQVWNEAYPLASGFWCGGFNDYMQRCYLPAAQQIRAQGGKVVYGGFPDVANVTKYIQVMDAAAPNYGAWATTDVLDIHYFSLGDMDTLYKAAATRGYSNIGIWQTEYGFTTAEGTIGNVNPRFLYWALNHGATQDPNRYKMSWFAYWSPNDPNAYGYKASLYSGDNLSNHGISLQTLGNLLNGSDLQVLSGVTNSKGWSASLTETSNSIESFQLDGSDVIAMHTTASSGQVTLTIPGFSKYHLGDLHAWRVDQSGCRDDLAGMFSLSGDNLTVSVNIADDLLSPVKSWYLGTSCNTFYLQIVVPEPSAGLSLLCGGGCLTLGWVRRVKRRRKEEGPAKRGKGANSTSMNPNPVSQSPV